MARKVATVQRVAETRPIEGADRIEVARVEGWDCVVGKGEFSPGEKVVYLEIDTFIPDGTPHLEDIRGSHREMLAAGVPTHGTVLRTAQLRGVYSQGLLLKLATFGIAEDAPVGTDVSSRLGVCLYEPIVSGEGLLGDYDGRLAPKTDAVRIQNLTELWPLLVRVTSEASVKVDGTSVTLSALPKDEDAAYGLRVLGHNNELNPAMGLGAVMRDCAVRQGLADLLLEHPELTLQAELVGPKVNGNRLGLAGYQLLVFSVWNNHLGRAPRQKLSLRVQAKAQPSIAASMVPQLPMQLGDYATPDELLAAVDGIKGNVTAGRYDESVVFNITDTRELTPEESDELERALGPNMEVKVISNKYLSKEKG